MFSNLVYRENIKTTVSYGLFDACVTIWREERKVPVQNPR